MKYKLLAQVAACAALLSAAACVEYEAEPFTGQRLPRVTGYKSGVSNDWLYINLRTGKMYNEAAPNRDIREGEQKTNEAVALEWDVAFCGYQMRTNSGTSGVGHGGGADLGYGAYEKWTSKAQVEGVVFEEDDSASVSIVYSAADWTSHLTQMAKQGLIKFEDFEQYPCFDPNSGPRTMVASANPVLSQAMSFSGPPPVYTASGHTYCVRSADGERFYKFLLISWYDAESDIGDEGGRLCFYLDELK